MVRAVAEEALALASVTLFLAMVAIWCRCWGRRGADTVRGAGGTIRAPR